MSADEINSLCGEFHDLKQFLVQEFAVVNGRLANVEEHVAILDRKIDTIDKKLDDLTAWTIETVDTTNETNAAQFKDHGMRLAFLENKAA